MKRSWPQLKTYVNATFGFILLLMAWMAFTPAQFGGRAVYLIISGVSMEPTLYTGDLVILHRTEDYEIGDIAAYYHPVADGIIIHRIIGFEAGRYVLLGDNKPDLDPYRPTPAEMVGRYWFHLPGVGHFISRLKSLGMLSPPVVIAFLAILLMPSLIVGRNRRQKKYGDSLMKTGQVSMAQSQLTQANRIDLIFFLTVLTAASAVLAVFGFNRPVTTTSSDEIGYEQQGSFSYTAAAPPGIYDANLVETGAPVFRQLINRVTINFDYRLVADLPVEITGDYRLLVELGHANGWHRTIELVPETSFQGPAVSLSSELDLSEIQSVIDNLEQQTGLPGQQYRLTVIPQVSIRGTLNGRPLQDGFAPRLAFNFDEAQMELAAPPSNRLNETQDDSLKPVQSGTITRPVQVPNLLSLLGLKLAVSTIRQISILGLIISAAGWLLGGWLLLRAQPEDEIGRIRFRYGSRLINIQESGWAAGQEVIEVATIDDLGQVAEQTGALIMHSVSGDHHHYLVKTGSLLYRYRVRSRPTAAPRPAPERAQ